MKKEIITYNLIEGFHNYPNAPEICGYLAAEHRHLFQVRCWAHVSHNDREIEINTMQNAIESELISAFGKPCMFGAMSCEDIAEFLLGKFTQLTKVQVLEDGYGGAALTR